MKRRTSVGILLVEAIVASFLMIFAFLASASLFDASLRWESRGSNLRRAGLLAERKMEEIRARSMSVPPGSTFASHLDGIIAGPHDPYPEAPDFSFTVTPLVNEHKKVVTSNFTPTDGVHSPCSSFYTRPLNPGSNSRSPSPYGATDPDGDYQRNDVYESFPYSRAMPNSYRLVEVQVNFGSGEQQTLKLISLIGDSILPPERPTGDNLDLTLKVVQTGGTLNLSTPSSFAEFRLDVTTANGSKVEDVSALWNIHPLSSGTVDVFPLSASGTEVRITRNDLSKPGTKLRLFPQIRYEGIEARATSAEIRL